jgi:hypothetical protein
VDADASQATVLTALLFENGLNLKSCFPSQTNRERWTVGSQGSFQMAATHYPPKISRNTNPKLADRPSAKTVRAQIVCDPHL